MPSERAARARWWVGAPAPPNRLWGLLGPSAGRHHLTLPARTSLKHLKWL